MNGTIIVFLLLGAFTFTGPGMQESRKGGNDMAPKKTVAQVLQQYTDGLMGISGVVGTGEGVYRGKPCIIVFVEKKSPALTKKIPKALEGFTVVIREVGKVKPLK
jgi:hypothetical protein